MHIRHSVIGTFEQIRLTEMELDLLRHQSSLSVEEIEENKKSSLKPEPGSLPPL